MRTSIFLASILAFFLALPAAANEASPSLEEIRVQQAEIGGQARAGTGIFEEVPQADRNRLLERQGAVLELIDGKHSASELGDSERMTVFNHLEEIKAIVQRAEDSRVVCEYKKKVGSHMKTRVCQTVAARRAETEKARAALDSRSICGNCRGE